MSDRIIGTYVDHWQCSNCLKIYHSREEAEECCIKEMKSGGTTNQKT